MDKKAPDDQPARVRQRLLREAVRENVHVKRGTRSARQRPIRRGRRTIAFTLGVVVLAFAVYLVPRSLSPDESPTPLADLPPVMTVAPLPTELDTLPPSEEDLVVLSTTRLDSSVLPLGVRRIVLDPGHGGRDVGTVTPEGLFEKDLALDIALRLRTLLVDGAGYEVVLTRDADEFVSLKDRATRANEARGDLFLSIHVNWFDVRSMQGVETYFLGSTDDPYLIELTSRENRDSGYSMADARRLLDGIYLDLRTDHSRSLASEIQGSLHRSLQSTNPSLRDRGVRSAPFIVLVTTDMPAVLAEVSCLSNREEAERLATTAYRQQIAEALLEGIESYTMSLSSDVGARGS